MGETITQSCYYKNIDRSTFIVYGIVSTILNITLLVIFILTFLIVLLKRFRENVRPWFLFLSLLIFQTVTISSDLITPNIASILNYQYGDRSGEQSDLKSNFYTIHWSWIYYILTPLTTATRICEVYVVIVMTVCASLLTLVSSMTSQLKMYSVRIMVPVFSIIFIAIYVTEVIHQYHTNEVIACNSTMNRRLQRMYTKVSRLQQLNPQLDNYEQVSMKVRQLGFYIVVPLVVLLLSVLLLLAQFFIPIKPPSSQMATRSNGWTYSSSEQLNMLQSSLGTVSQKIQLTIQIVRNKPLTRKIQVITFTVAVFYLLNWTIQFVTHYLNIFNPTVIHGTPRPKLGKALEYLGITIIFLCKLIPSLMYVWFLHPFILPAKQSKSGPTEV